MQADLRSCLDSRGGCRHMVLAGNSKLETGIFYGLYF